MRNSLLIIIIIVHCVPLYTQDIDEFLRQQDGIRQAAINKEFPAFIAVSLDGDTITEKELNEKIVMVNFWFTPVLPV